MSSTTLAYSTTFCSDLFSRYGNFYHPDVLREGNKAKRGRSVGHRVTSLVWSRDVTGSRDVVRRSLASVRHAQMARVDVRMPRTNPVAFIQLCRDGI